MCSDGNAFIMWSLTLSFTMNKIVYSQTITFSATPFNGDACIHRACVTFFGEWESKGKSQQESVGKTYRIEWNENIYRSLSYDDKIEGSECEPKEIRQFIVKLMLNSQT